MCANLIEVRAAATLAAAASMVAPPWRTCCRSSTNGPRDIGEQADPEGLQLQHGARDQVAGKLQHGDRRHLVPPGGHPRNLHAPYVTEGGTLNPCPAQRPRRRAPGRAPEMQPDQPSPGQCRCRLLLT